MEAIIQFNNVTKKYPDGTKALKGISVTIPKQKLTAIIGPSGCGKTTLMKMVNRLESPSEGEVLIDGNPISTRNVVELRRSIGYVIQRIGLIPHMTIRDNVALVPGLLKWDQSKIETRVNELLNLVGLDPDIYIQRYPLELSGGQQQRIGVARALAGNPNIILMDEPFSALDPISREQLQIELKKLQTEIQKTIVFVTHDMDEALDIADNIIVMRDGQIEQMGSPNELIEHQENEFVRDFIGLKRITKKHDFSKMELKYCKKYYLDTWTGDVQEVSQLTTIQEAISILDTMPNSRLAIKENGSVVGYVGYDSLLQAALNDRRGGSEHE